MIKKIVIIVALLFFSKVHGQALIAMPVSKEFEHFKLVKVDPNYNETDYIALMKAKD